MSKMLSEQKVLKKLGIPDFRHLTKEKVITLASISDRIEPEVAKKAIEQFPNFSEAIQHALEDLRNVIDTTLASNDKSVTTYYDACNLMLNGLNSMLQNPELSFDEKKYIIEQMAVVVKMMDAKDSENKRFFINISAVVTFALAFAGLVAASVLGSNAKITTVDEDDEDDEYDMIYDSIPDEDNS